MMVYSPEVMEDRGIEQDNVEGLEEKVGELERLTDSLGDVPDEELVETLNDAVERLAEINAGIEASLDNAGDESREIGALLGQVDFGPFDEALEDHETRERTTGEPGP
ncbi:MAG TPA: hypothetical protein VF068_11960 [Rubrobacter sp.]